MKLANRIINKNNPFKDAIPAIRLTEGELSTSISIRPIFECKVNWFFLLNELVPIRAQWRYTNDYADFRETIARMIIGKSATQHFPMKYVRRTQAHSI